MFASLRRQVVIAGLTLAIIAVMVVVSGRPATTGAEVPAAGGIYVEGVVGHPAYLNPLLSAFNAADADIVSLVFSGLTRLASDGTVAPDLAESWQISPDGTVYTFHLGQAAWHDGEPVTADDVVFTIEQIQDPAFPGTPEMARLWKSVKVAKIDDHTVRFTLSEPYAPFLEYTTLGLLPSHLLKGVSGRALLSNPFNAQPIGTGPFQVKSANLREVVLTAYARGPGRPPYLAGLTFRYYDSFDAALNALRHQEIQGLGNIPPNHVLDLADDPRLALLQQPVNAQLNVLILNTQSPLFADKRVRKALDLAIDRIEIIHAAAGGAGAPAVGPISPASWAFAAQSDAYTYDPDRAAGLLDAAGWIRPAPGAVRVKNGNPLRFALLAVDQPDRLRTAQEIARQLRAAGIEANVQTANWSTIVQDFLAPRHFETVLTELYAPTADPDPYPFWHSSQVKDGLNVSGWSDPTADQFLEEGRKARSQDERQADYARFQVLFAEQQPSILLYYPVYAYAVPAPLKGISLGHLLQPSDRFRSVSDWYLRTRNTGPGG